MDEKQSTVSKIVISLTLVLVIVLIGLLIFYIWNDKKKTTSDNNMTITNNQDNNNYIRETEAEVLLDRNMEYELYADLSIKDGSIVATTKKLIEDKTNNDNYIIDTNYKTQTKTFTIKGEKIKYIHNCYDQPGTTNTIYVLTESGNVYINEFQTSEKTANLDAINKFKKTNYTNVKELVKVKNDNYQNEDKVSGLIDYIEYYIHTLTNDGKTSTKSIGNY